MDRRHRREGGAAWLALILIGALPCAAGAADVPAELAAVRADLEYTVTTADGRGVPSRSKLLLAGMVARVEVETGSEQTDYAEFQLYDFERQKFVRVFPQERVYFDLSLSLPQAVRAWMDGWAPPPAGATVREIPMKDDDVEGVPARLSLIERRLRKDGPLRYAFVWRSVAPSPLPLRVIFNLDRSRTVTVRYRQVQALSVPPARFSIPEGFANLSPF